MSNSSPRRPGRASSSGKKAGRSGKPGKKRKNPREIQKRNRSILLVLLCVFCFLFLICTVRHWVQTFIRQPREETDTSEQWKGAPPIDVQLLTVNPFSRPGIAMESVNGIVIHYTANPGSGAMDNRNYFENLKDTQETKVSSHFVVGIDGEIVQCIPSSEISYASNSRNGDTLSIECCHLDESGAFTKATYDSVVHLTAWLCLRFDVPVDNVIRHYDVTGKMCPLYYVEHPEAWEQMKEDIRGKMAELAG